VLGTAFAAAAIIAALPFASGYTAADPYRRHRPIRLGVHVCGTDNLTGEKSSDSPLPAEKYRAAWQFVIRSGCLIISAVALNAAGKRRRVSLLTEDEAPVLSAHLFRDIRL
jgi:hypothetical protein